MQLTLVFILVHLSLHPMAIEININAENIKRIFRDIFPLQYCLLYMSAPDFNNELILLRGLLPTCLSNRFALTGNDPLKVTSMTNMFSEFICVFLLDVR